jgi:predicted component of type VI protein secretion system
MKAELVPNHGGTPIPITRDVTVVGRREYCDVQIDHPSLSKRHCVLVRTDGLLMIRDLATTNGTKVNGQKVLWAALLPNDRVTLGRCKFRVYLGGDDTPSPSERLGKGVSAPAAVRQAPAPAAAARAPVDNGLGFAAPTPIGSPAVVAVSGSSDAEAEMIGIEDLILDDDDNSDELEILDLD